MKKFLQRHSQVKKYAFILLIAIEFLMSFTFLGYIHIPPISITFAYIPILVAGCFLGIGQATFLGLLFGLASMYKATAFYVLSSDRMFSPFLSGSPAASLFLSVGTRTLFGLLVGLAFFLVRRFFPYKRLGIGIISFLAPTVHAAMVYTAMALLFPRQNSGGYLYFHAGSEQCVCHPAMRCIVTGFMGSIQTPHCPQFLFPCQSADRKSPRKKSFIYCMGYFYFVYHLRCDCFLLLFCQSHVLHADGSWCHTDFRNQPRPFASAVPVYDCRIFPEFYYGNLTYDYLQIPVLQDISE